MKGAMIVLLETLLLLIAAVAGFFAGVLRPSLQLARVVSQTASSVRTYDFDWLVAVLTVYVLLLLPAAAGKRIRTGWIAPTIALLLTLLIVLVFTRLGFKDTPIY